MKKSICIIAVVACLNISGPVHSQTNGYIQITDGDPGDYCASGTGFYPVALWIWCYHNYGQVSVDFAIGYPSNIIQSTMTIHDDIVAEAFGDLSSGITVSYYECQYDWTSPLHQAIYVTDPQLEEIHIVNHADYGEARIATCEQGNPHRPACKCWFYINYDDVNCPVY